MKRERNIPFLPFLLALLMVAPGAVAQTTQDLQTEIEREPARSTAISAARSPYIRYAEAEGISRDADDGMTLAQVSRGRPNRPSPPRRGYPRRSHPSVWMGHGNAGHAVIGAVIGFGLGAALGAKTNKDRHPGATADAVVIFGGFGALIGAAAGAAHGGPYPFAHHQRSRSPSWRKDLDEGPELSAGSVGFHPAVRPAE